MEACVGDSAGGAEQAAWSSGLAFGGLRIGLRCAEPLSAIAFPAWFESFRTEAPPEVEIELRFAAPREADLAGTRLVFDSEGLWQLRADDDRLLFALRGLDDGRLYRLASFDPGLARGEIVSDPGGLTDSPGALLPDPLEYPLGEALTISLLAAGRGLLVHACGLVLDGRGFLLAGHSGSGKSTLARLASGRCRVLNDDRIILRLVDGVPWIHGTPWHGDFGELSATGAPLAGLWFIEPGPRHRTSPLGAGRAAVELVARSFPPLWSAAGMDFTLSFVDEVVTRVPCSSLEFTPDLGVLDEVLQ